MWSVIDDELAYVVLGKNQQDDSDGILPSCGLYLPGAALYNASRGLKLSSIYSDIQKHTKPAMSHEKGLQQHRFNACAAKRSL